MSKPKLHYSNENTGKLKSSTICEEESQIGRSCIYILYQLISKLKLRYGISETFSLSFHPI